LTTSDIFWNIKCPEAEGQVVVLILIEKEVSPMRQILYAGVVAFLAVVLAIPAVCPAECEEPAIAQVTDNDTNDINVRVSGAYAVWQGRDTNEGDWEIFFYNGRKIIQLTDNNTNDINPQIYGRNVVWQGKNTNQGNWEIFYYDGNNVTQLTDNSTNDIKPQIRGGNVVWQGKDSDGGDWEIFLYNGECVQQLTNNDFNDINPQLSEKKVFWQAWDGNNWEIMTAAIAVPVRITISPRTLNLKSQGQWITAKVWLGDTVQAADVNIASIKLLGQVTLDRILVSEKPNTLIIKFSRSKTQALLEPGNQVITLTGETNDGTVFSASDKIKVIKPGHSQYTSSGASFTCMSFGSFDEMVIPTMP
jgi:hypothetical protein